MTTTTMWRSRGTVTCRPDCAGAVPGVPRPASELVTGWQPTAAASTAAITPSPVSTTAILAAGREPAAPGVGSGIPHPPAGRPCTPYRFLRRALPADRLAAAGLSKLASVMHKEAA